MILPDVIIHLCARTVLNLFVHQDTIFSINENARCSGHNAGGSDVGMKIAASTYRGHTRAGVGNHLTVQKTLKHNNSLGMAISMSCAPAVWSLRCQPATIDGSRDRPHEVLIIISEFVCMSGADILSLGNDAFLTRSVRAQLILRYD
jgi:hypothetical protein